MYYTITLLPNFILFSLNRSVFSISVENSVDPDKMASERNQLKPADQDLVFSKMESTEQGLILGLAGQG